MGFKTKTTAVAGAMFIVINAVGVHANTAITSNTVSTLCGSAFVGCVLPGATTKKAETVANAPTAPAADAEEKNSSGGSGGLIIGALSVASIVAGILIASGGDDDDAPASP